ncbi:MAG: hypothetical protein LBU56_03100 [Rickettsiales bacterium]|nr:hypothetical protein [Rickettsiales bacterium]
MSSVLQCSCVNLHDTLLIGPNHNVCIDVRHTARTTRRGRLDDKKATWRRHYKVTLDSSVTRWNDRKGMRHHHRTSAILYDFTY